MGPEYDIYYKYSELETLCIICCIFGPGIPVLFPLGLLAITVKELTEKFAIAKLYRKPPRYQMKLT